MPDSRAACFHRRGQRGAVVVQQHLRRAIGRRRRRCLRRRSRLAWSGSARSVAASSSCARLSRWKYSSKHSSNRFFSSGVFASTRASVSFSTVRSENPTTCTARAASMPSAAETRMPALRAAWRNWRRAAPLAGSSCAPAMATGRQLNRQPGLLPCLLRQRGDLLVRRPRCPPRTSAARSACRAPARRPAPPRAAAPARAPSRSSR